MFAENLRGRDLYCDAVAVLKDEYWRVFKIIKGSEELGDPDEAVSAAEEPKEDV